MKNKKIRRYLHALVPFFGAIFVVTITVLLLTNAFAFTDKKPTVTDFQTALNNIPNYKPSVETRTRVENYFSDSSSWIMTHGLNLLLEKNLDAQLAAAKKQIASLKMDGKIDDWQSAGLVVADDVYDSFEINKDELTGVRAGQDDIVSYGFIMDANYLYAYIAPREMPKSGQKYNYRLNLNSLQTNWMQYALVYKNSGTFIEEYNPDTQQFVRNVSKTGAVFVKKNIVEFKIPIKNLKKLPKTFQVSAIIWHDWKNLKDEAVGLSDFTQSINEKFGKAALEVLCRFAEKTELIPDDPIFLAQALTDAFWYKLADSQTKEKLINDSLILIAKLRAAEQTYAFVGQKDFDDLNWSALLALTNRSVMHGSYVDWTFYLDNSGSMNEEAYEFMLIRPETIDVAERIIADNFFVDTQNLPATIEKIENFLNNKLKYRRLYFKDIETLRDAYPGDAYWENIYRESFEDIENNEINIAVVNNREINKGNNFSASFQVQYLADHGYYFGNCVDVAAIAIPFYRALGIPALPISYFSIADGYLAEVHTFPLYYSGSDDKWFNYTRGGNPLWPFSKVDYISDYNVFFFINAPQLGSAWSLYYHDFSDNNVKLNTRKAANIISEEGWAAFNKTGYSMSDMEALLFE